MKPQLKNSLIATAVAIPLGSLVGAVVSVIPGGNFDTAQIYVVVLVAFFFQGMLFAFPFALLYGAPLHYLFARWNWANYLTSAVFGGLPAVVMYLAGEPAWEYALYYGVAIATIYHAAITRLGRKSDKSSPHSYVSSG